MQWQADALRLLPQQFPPHAVHADAVVAIRDGGEQSHYADQRILQQNVQGHGAVFAAAPAKKNWLTLIHQLRPLKV